VVGTSLDADRFASIDPEEFFDYQTTRPTASGRQRGDDPLQARCCAGGEGGGDPQVRPHPLRVGDDLAHRGGGSGIHRAAGQSDQGGGRHERIPRSVLTVPNVAPAQVRIWLAGGGEMMSVLMRSSG